VLAAFALLALAYWLWNPFQDTVRRVLDIFSRADIEQLRKYLRSFGIWAPIVSALLMIVQAVLFPLPALILTVTNGLVFGAFWGTVLSWSSAMAAAAVCWAIGRMLGRPVVERLVNKKTLELADRFFKQYGKRSVLIARLIPVMSFDVVSYAAGLTPITFPGFMAATGIGQLPATVVYSILGQNLPRAVDYGLFVLGSLAALLALAFILKRTLMKRIAGREDRK